MPAKVEKNDQGLPVIEQGGMFRALACLAPHPLCSISRWSDTKALIPRNQWQEISVAFDAPILDQKQTNACVGFSSTAAVLKGIRLANSPLVNLAPLFLYSLINGGIDGGAVISDALTALRTYGVAPADTVSPNAMFRSQMPARAFNAALRFRIIDAYSLHSFDELGTALSLGHICVSGITVGQNFGDLDIDGVCPPPEIVLGGHALCHDGLKFSRNKNAWLIETANSWGTNWGMNGRCRLSEENWVNPLSMPFDSFAIELTPTDPANDQNVPPPVSSRRII